jgi:hypothetical protein
MADGVILEDSSKVFVSRIVDHFPRWVCGSRRGVGSRGLLFQFDQSCFLAWRLAITGTQL